MPPRPKSKPMAKVRFLPSSLDVERRVRDSSYSNLLRNDRRLHMILCMATSSDSDAGFHRWRYRVLPRRSR